MSFFFFFFPEKHPILYHNPKLLLIKSLQLTKWFNMWLNMTQEATPNLKDDHTGEKDVCRYTPNQTCRALCMVGQNIYIIYIIYIKQTNQTNNQNKQANKQTENTPHKITSSRARGLNISAAVLQLFRGFWRLTGMSSKFHTSQVLCKIVFSSKKGRGKQKLEGTQQTSPGGRWEK